MNVFVSSFVDQFIGVVDDLFSQFLADFGLLSFDHLWIVVQGDQQMKVVVSINEIVGTKLQNITIT